jgi:HAE1 family hydrophobic/amphiphilic exporter-1
MNISEFCIRHPVATTLMSAALVVSGVFAYMFLPVAALPRTEFPVVNVSASLPGASPDTMANAVATPLIKQFSAIAGIDSISSTSSQGSISIAIQFELNRDIDSAAADVQSAIARVQKQLPAEMTDPPSYRKVNPADAPILLLTLSSEVAPLQDMDAFAQQVRRDGFGREQPDGELVQRDPRDPARRVPSAGSQHRRGGRSHQGAAAELPKSIAPRGGAGRAQ